MLRRYLPSVVENNNDQIADVVVVDNGSTDNSVEIIKSEFPTVKLLAFNENYGFAEGYNRAIRQLGYKYSLLLNSDVAVSPHWLEPLYEYLEENRDVAAVQPKILSDSDRISFEYAGACGGFIDKHGYPYCRGRVFDCVEKDNGQYDDVIEISGQPVRLCLSELMSILKLEGLTRISLHTWRRLTCAGEYTKKDTL